MSYPKPSNHTIEYVELCASAELIVTVHDKDTNNNNDDSCIILLTNSEELFQWRKWSLKLLIHNLKSQSSYSFLR